MRREDDAPELDADDRALIDRLRALPGEGNEPDWTALERQIRSALPAEAPRPWWRRWRFLLPVGSLAVVAAIALLWLHRSEPAAPPVATTSHEVAHHELVAPAEPAMSMWLGGKIVEVDDLDSALPDEVDRDARDALATSDEGAESVGSILPVTDLNWIDSLDDSALDRAETWLASKKKG